MLARVLLVFAAASLFIPGALLAQSATESPESAERITLSPAVSRPNTTSAGGTFSGSLKVINDGNVDYDFAVYARPFSVSGEEYTPDYDTVTERTEAYQWVQFEKTKFTLKAGERIDVGYVVNIPDMAMPGGHYAVLFAETQPSTSEGAESVVRKKRVGSLLYMTVDGDLAEKGSASGIAAKFLQTSRPIAAEVRMKNEGNVHYQANLSARFKSVLGKKNFQLNQEVIVMPGTTRKLPIVWESAPAVGIFKASGTVTYLGETEQLSERYILFVPKPWLITIFVGVGVCIIGIVIKRHYGRKPAQKKHAK